MCIQHRSGALYLCLLLLVVPAAAQQAPAEEKGFRPEKMYDFGSIDEVNTFNGNVVVSTPIGMRYPLDSGLTYGLSLTYNSKVWDFEEWDNNTQRSSPGRRANAGLGWLLSLGRLVPPNDTTNPTNEWIYEAPDGADHSFAADFLYTTASGCTGSYCGGNKTMYSHDGSFLRMRMLTTSLRTVESGDGTTSEFELVSGAWRLKRISNAFKDNSGNPLNYVDVTYPNPALIGVCPAATSVWQLNDSKGRQHFVCFKNQNLGGNQAPMVDRIVLAGVGENATYLFEYDLNQTIHESCQDTAETDPETAPTEFHVPFLRRVKLPDGETALCTGNDCSRFQFDYYVNNCPTGALQAVTLPTLGKIAYNYGAKIIQPNAPCSPPTGANTVGVSTRTLSDALGSTIGVWTYDVHNVFKGSQHYTSHEVCGTGPGGQELHPPIFDEAIGTVTDPAGDKVVQHYSVWPGNPDDPFDEISFDTFRRQDYSLPIGKYDADVTANLATEMLDCDASGNNCTTLRKRYVRYRLDPSTWDAELAHKTITAERTVYLDDPVGGTPRYAHVEYDDYDGLGHYRSTITSGSFENDNARTSITNFNPGTDLHGSSSGNLVFSTDDPWILGTYDSVTTTDTTGSNTGKFCFDRTTGFLRASRVGLQNSTRDLVTLLVAETVSVGGPSIGNVASEIFYGGDTMPLSASAASQSICTIANVGDPGTIGYRIDHTYTSGVRVTSKYAGLPFFFLNRNVHPTGLTLETRDTNADLVTTYGYDRGGRLKSIQPPGQAATAYDYTQASVSGGLFTPARVKSTTNSTVGGHVEREYQFDALGRYWREKRLMPNGSRSFRQMLYDALNRKTSVSELETLTVPPGGSEYTVTPAHATTFSNYDAFGRARTITAPDGKATTFSFTGASSMTRTMPIATAVGIETPVPTTETYDRHGRLIRVDEPGEISATTTSYGYDVGNRLASVNMTDGTQMQNRFFHYDARGLLKDEQHPELGVNGNGTTAYGTSPGGTFVGSYDARGHATRKVTGSVDLTMAYDAAERLTSVQKTTGGQLLKQFAYDDPTGAVFPQCSGSRCNGKLAAAARFNLVPDLGTVAVTEAYQYDGLGGRVSRRDRAIGSTPTFEGEVFFHAQTYNDLGDVASVIYPCRATNCDHSSPTISLGYANGALTAVADLASITYQPNGAIDTVTHGGAIHEKWTPDPNGMARPANIRVTNAIEAEQWSSGNYAFDGAGNVKQIGNKTYAYDVRSRLTKWTETFGAGGYGSTIRGYDSFGNFLSTMQNGCGPGGSHCYSSGVLSYAVNGATNHYADLTYDDLGDVTHDLGRTFTYDPLGVMTGATLEGRAFRYLYSADDERIALVEIGAGAGNRTTWTIRGFNDQLLSTWTDDTTSGTRVLAWKEDQFWRGAELLASTSDSGTKHFSLDHLGSPRYVTTSGGQYIGTQSFEPFGGGGTIDGGPNQFTGHERDAATVGGASSPDMPDYFHQRYFDLRLGRFLSVDPVIGKATLHNPQMWNRYSYVRNNPLTLTDPTGKIAELPSDCANTKTTCKELRALRDGVPAELRMFVRATIVNGKTVVDKSFLNMKSGASSGNFQALRTVANDRRIVTLDMRYTHNEVRRNDGATERYGMGTGTAGITIPASLSLSGNTELYMWNVGGRRESAEVMAHEIHHARRDLLGLPNEDAMLDEKTGEWVRDPNSPANEETDAAEAEVRENFDPFQPPF